jgi:hypothetical protein
MWIECGDGIHGMSVFVPNHHAGFADQLILQRAGERAFSFRVRAAQGRDKSIYHWRFPSGTGVCA